MKKRIHLSLILIGATVLTPLQTPAQPSSQAEDANLNAILEMTRSDMNSYKIHTLNEVMAMTAPEAEKFWPIYQAYEKELMGFEDEGLAQIREFLELQASGATDGKKWDSLAKDVLKNKRDRLKLWEKYQKQISRKVSPYRAAQFLQIEHQMRLLIDLNIAEEMPVITAVDPSTVMPPDDAPTREESVLVTVTAVVESINHAKRELTLQGPLGNSIIFVVDERVKRLNEVLAGDTVQADYYVSVAAELRAPTAEEIASPLVIVETGGRVPAGAQPAGGALRLIKAVCTIEALNRPEQTVTVQGPLGELVTVQSAVPAYLPNLRIGDTVLVTYTEALAISLRKVDFD